MAEPERDADILDACRRGDPQAQRALFERYRDRVFSIALHFLKGDHASAQDVTQEVFVKVFRAVRSFRGDARFSTWLYRIVARACTDERRRRRRLLFFGELPVGIHPTVANTASAPDAEVLAALNRLSDKLRMVVLLRYFDDLSYDEIASALDVSPGTVASRLSRAHDALARQLAHRRPGVAQKGGT
jgi:RNA polymerase sigma-70 factor (ECF subfamily)